VIGTPLASLMCRNHRDAVQRSKRIFARLRHAIVPALFLSGTASAAPTPGHLLHYTARLHGVPLLDISFCMALSGTTYASTLSARTLGLLEFLVHGRSEAHVEGTIDGLHVKPGAYAEHGRLSGEAHSVMIAYPGGEPELREMSPPLEKYRLPIPGDQRRGAMDGLSAIVLESLVATGTGACQGQALVYDGFQLRRATTHTAGTEQLQATPRSIFGGTALRCETQSVMLAGYLKDKPVPPQARPRFSTAWLGRLAPEGPMVPLKLSFDADVLGDIIVDLDHASETSGCTPDPASSEQQQ